jgi:hypothetical protein
MGKNKQNQTIEEAKEGIKEGKARMWFYLALGIIVGLIILYFIFSVFSVNINNLLGKAKTFKYNGLDFIIETENGATLYHHSYLIKYEKSKAYKNNIFLRKDPRKNKVPVEGKILFLGERVIYSTMNTSGLLNCSDILRDVSFIPYFLTNNLYDVIVSLADEKEAKESNVLFVTCEKDTDKKIIFIKAGNETRIVKEGNCTTIMVANCELLDASEKLQVQYLIDERERLGLK